MDEKLITEDRRRETTRLDNESQGNAPDESDIGTGKKVGLYGCAFLILALVAVIIIVLLTGTNVPFVGTEGAGP